MMIHDPSDQELYKLKVNLNNGDTSMVPMPIVNDAVANPSQDRDGLDLEPKDRFFFKLPKKKTPKKFSLPSQGFKLRVQPVVDSRFVGMFGEETEDKVAGIMTYTNLFFKRSTGFRIDLDVLPTKRINVPMPASATNLM